MYLTRVPQNIGLIKDIYNKVISMNRDLNVWLDNYSQDHQNKVNQRIHFICVPTIFLSVFGLLWVIPAPDIHGLELKWTYALVLGGTVFYLLLSFFYASLMLGLSALICWLLYYMEESTNLPILWIFATLFVVAWIGQFYGHKVEGKKPSFFTDLTYLFIGPIWTMDKLFRKRN